MEKLVKAQMDWIEVVRDAWVEADDAEVEDHIEISKAKWEALSNAITAPVRIK